MKATSRSTTFINQKTLTDEKKLTLHNLQKTGQRAEGKLQREKTDIVPELEMSERTEDGIAAQPPSSARTLR